jgi:hypothetical protein
MLLSKSAADGQGEGVSYDIAIDRADRGKVMRLALKYEIASGTYSGGTSTTDSDVIAYLYRVDSTARLIEPVPFKLNGGVVGQQYELNAEFQTDTDATNYRLMLHVATTSASAYTIKFEWQLSAVLASNGPPMTDWTSYSLTIGADTTAPTKGTINLDQAMWRRVGDSVEIKYNFRQTSAGTAGSGIYLFPLPSGLVIDTTKANYASASVGKSHCGDVMVDDGTTYEGSVNVYDSTNLFLTIGNASTSFGSMSSTLAPLSGSDVRIGFRAILPIAGWSAAQAVNNGSARTVSARGYNTAGTSVADVTDTALPLTIDYDLTGSLSTSAVFTAPFAGIYAFDGCITFLDSMGIGNTIDLIYKLNGTTIKVIRTVSSAAGSQYWSASGGDEVRMKAGDTLSVFVRQNSGANRVLSSTTGHNTFSIHRVAGPEQIVASEKVYLDAYRSSNQSINDSTQTTIVIDTIVSDSHQALNTSTGVWTAPRADFYTITGKLRFAANAVGTRSIRVRKNGSTSIMELQIQTHPTGITTISDTRSVYLVQGDTIELRALQDSGGALNVNGGSADTYLTISGQ